jgi:DNA-binding response OmpR family regulator
MEDRDKASSLGADGFLTKDSSMKELQASLTRLLHFDRADEISGGEQFRNFKKEG